MERVLVLPIRTKTLLYGKIEGQESQVLNISQQQVFEFISSSPYFSHMDERERRGLVREFDLISLAPRQELYHQGSRADAFYLVFQGRMTLTRQRGKRIVGEISLGKGDSLGHESLLRNGVCAETAFAEDEVILLRMRGDRLGSLVDQYPRLAESRSMLAGSESLRSLINLEWLNRDERLHLISRKHLFFLFIRAFIPGLFILVSLIVLLLSLQEIIQLPQAGLVGLAVTSVAGMFWILWVSLDWSNDYFILTSQRLVRVDRKAAVFDRREEIPLGNVMSVDITTSPLGKMLSFADVTARTYNSPVVWHGIPNPDLVSRMIQICVERAKSGHAELEMSAMQAALENQLYGSGTDDLVSEQQDHPAVHANERTTTFRKHWVILFRKTWLPFSGLVASLYALLGGMTYLDQPGITDTIKAFTIVTALLFGIWYLYQYLDWRNDTYQITPDQIMDVKRTPLGREDRKTALLENIQSINYRRRGLFGLLMNYGTVTIQVGTEVLVFDYVRDPSGVQREVFRRIAERQAALRQANVDSERERMSQWIAAYHRKINE